MQLNQKTSCVWLYMWLIDKMTKIDLDTGIGKIWGGKPIVIERDLKEFGNVKTVTKILKKLEDEGYIQTIRTPYGKTICVLKAKKIYGLKTEKSKESGVSLPPKSKESGVSNKTIYYNDKILIDKEENNLPGWLDKQAWQDWLEYRRQAKKPMTEITIKQQIKLLSQYKEDHVKMLENSIAFGYTGLFPIKKTYSQKLDTGTPYVKGKYSDKSKEIIDD